MVKNPPANAGDTKDTGLIPGLGRHPGGGAPETICKDDLSSQNECNRNEIIKVRGRGFFSNFIKMTLFPSTVGSLLSRVDTCVGLFQKDEVQRESQAEVPT